MRTIIGKQMDKTKNTERFKNYIGEKHPRWQPDKLQFALYRRKVTRLTEANYKRDIDIINPKRLPRRLAGIQGGWQLDHKISVKRGFEMGINPLWIAASDNLQMLPWKANNFKRAK